MEDRDWIRAVGLVPAPGGRDDFLYFAERQSEAQRGSSSPEATQLVSGRAEF